MPLALPRFYAIIDRSIRPELSLEELVAHLGRAGVRLIQLRAKQATSQLLWAEASQLLSLLPPSASLLVNDRADVAQLVGAAGVHVGGRDLSPTAARSFLGPEKLIGFSTHTEREVAEATGWPVDYIGFGPIFPTRSKADAEAVVGCEGLRRARALTSKPLVAIGGITPANAAAVLAAGADSVAVIGAWLLAPDIAGCLEEFRQAVGRLD